MPTATDRKTPGFKSEGSDRDGGAIPGVPEKKLRFPRYSAKVIAEAFERVRAVDPLLVEAVDDVDRTLFHHEDGLPLMGRLEAASAFARYAARLQAGMRNARRDST